MNYIDGFRNQKAGRALSQLLQQQGEALSKRQKPLRVMEVCGSHTMAIARFGIRQLLPIGLELVSGPGCPVCVTQTGYLDAALELAGQGHIIATFGDMLRVPGSQSTLMEARSQGAEIQVCASPVQAVALAQANPQRQVIFLAIGFETTIAPVLTLVREAQRHQLGNLSLLTAFKQVPPALDALIADPEIDVHAFICPAHVSAIIGADAYRTYPEQHRIPCVIAGFEPLDILYALSEIVDQHLKDTAKLTNHYNRVVSAKGNQKALSLIHHYTQAVDAEWRGLGMIPKSGLGLKPEFHTYDAQHKFSITIHTGADHPACACGEVLKGKIQPTACPLFGKGCHPGKPLGPCMVSSEGSCAAAFKYREVITT
jgi:hydrogenase expression/formation protein HypD